MFEKLVWNIISLQLSTWYQGLRFWISQWYLYRGAILTTPKVPAWWLCDTLPFFLNTMMALRFCTWFGLDTLKVQVRSLRRQRPMCLFKISIYFLNIPRHHWQTVRNPGFQILESEIVNQQWSKHKPAPYGKWPLPIIYINVYLL